jgi:hypothetical protein
MSLLGNVYAMFQPKAATPSPAPTNNPAANPPPAMTPDPAAPNAPAGSGDGPDTPTLQKYEKLFEPQKPDENAGAQNQGIDPQAIMQAAAKVDFRKAIPQEALAKIAAGGEDAVEAFAMAMNAVAQQTYAQSAVTAAKLAEKLVQQAQDNAMGSMPEFMRRQRASEAILESNPGFANPAVQPLVNMVSEQLMQKFPKASPKEIQTMAMEHLSGMAALINPGKPAASAKTGQGEDWEKYFSA